MKKRTEEEVKAYREGYEACYKKFHETFINTNFNIPKALCEMHYHMLAVQGKEIVTIDGED